MEKYEELFNNVNISFIKSASNISQCPEVEGVEFALMGRSNVGKSSFLNHIFRSKSIAKVSKQPGKTKLINFFKFNNDITFVDLPGYGYAKVSHKERESWGDMIKEYLENRDNLAGVIWLIDFRREKGTDIDIEAAQFLSELNIPLFVVLTKSDKLNQKEKSANSKSIKKVYNFPDEMPLLQFTTTRDKTREQFWDLFHRWVSAE